MAGLAPFPVLAMGLLLAGIGLAACEPEENGRTIETSGELSGEQSTGPEVSSTGVFMRAWSGPPDGAVARGAAARREALKAPGPAVTSALIEAGRAGFTTFCTPCHGERGHGDGPVAERGFPRPPSFYEPRLRSLDPAAIVAVITHGRGAMWSYAGRVRPQTRWAIAHYVKRLQAEGTAAGVGKEASR